MSSAVVLAAFALGGCGGSAARPPATTAEPVNTAEWKAVIRDWLNNGRVAHQHSCAAVRAAIEHLPSTPPIFSTVYADLRDAEQKACWNGVLFRGFRE